MLNIAKRWTVLIIVIVSRLIPSMYAMNCSQTLVTIDFVVSSNMNEAHTFELPLTATLVDLQRMVARKCGLQHPFEIQLLGETIVPARHFTNQMICHIPRIESISWMLAEIWNVTEGFRIPLKVHRCEPNKDDVDYVSLLEMFGGSESNIEDFEWYQFIQRCTRTKSCFIQDLCTRFNAHFKCKNGMLTEIKLDHQKMTGIIDLSALPSTVRRLNVERNLLTGIIGLDQLTGKRLRHLKIRKNSNLLEIDLDPLIRSSLSDDNPLRIVWVMARQISRYLDIAPGNDAEDIPFLKEKVQQATKRWINLSILERIMMGWDTCTLIQRRETIGPLVIRSRNKYGRSSIHYFDSQINEQSRT